MKELVPSESRELAIQICEFLEGKKTEKVELFNVAHLSSLTDYFVMTTLSNATQVKSIAEELEVFFAKNNIKILRRDGVNEWIVLDYGFVIVHIFTPAISELYHLDRLWNDGKNTYNLATLKKVLEKEEKVEKQKAEKMTRAKEKEDRKKLKKEIQKDKVKTEVENKEQEKEADAKNDEKEQEAKAQIKSKEQKTKAENKSVEPEEKKAKVKVKKVEPEAKVLAKNKKVEQEDKALTKTKKVEQETSAQTKSKEQKTVVKTKKK